MANGVPVVQPRRGSFPEILEATGGGLLVDRDSPEALAAGIQRVLENRELAAELGRRGHASVHRDWGIARVAERVLGVYRSVGAAGGSQALILRCDVGSRPSRARAGLLQRCPFAGTLMRRFARRRRAGAWLDGEPAR
jgi:hypothetical protein